MNLPTEYEIAKAKHRAAKSSKTRAAGKENNANRSLRPTFDPPGTKKSSKSEPVEAEKRLRLPMEYNTAKLQFKAAAGKGKKDGTMSTRPVTRSSLTRKTPSKSEEAIDSDVDANATTTVPPTVESGLELLGLLRPIDNKTYEFGLARGIQVHLSESVKLCGLRKGREKSILDMVDTLCAHLENREDEINRWIEFADRTALAAGEKLDGSTKEHEAVCRSRDAAQGTVKQLRRSLLSMQKELSALKGEFMATSREVANTLGAFPPLIRAIGGDLRRQLDCHSDSVRSECKSEACDATDRIIALHDREKQRYEAAIGSLEKKVQDEVHKSLSLRTQLEQATAARETMKSEHTAIERELKSDAAKDRSKLRLADERIKSLEELLECAKAQKKSELESMERKMKGELDEIDAKVKQSFQSLVEKKDAEIENALARAQAAEASAKAAERLLTDLKERFSSIPTKSSASEATIES